MSSMPQVKRHLRKKIRVATLTELEKQILLFFVNDKMRRTTLVEILDINRKYMPVEVLEAVVKLYNAGIVVVLYDSTVCIDNIPLLLQVFLSLKRYASALLLYVLFKQKRYEIDENKRVTFNYQDIPYFTPIEDAYVEELSYIYYKRKQTFWHAIQELINEDYLIPLNKNRYEFKYDIIEKSLREFLYSLFGLL